MTFCDKKDYAGICPACGSYVRLDEPDGPVWVCPSDLSPQNPFWEPAPGEPEYYKRQESEGYFGICPEDSGDYCPYKRLPLHSACYDRGSY